MTRYIALKSNEPLDYILALAIQNLAVVAAVHAFP